MDAERMFKYIAAKAVCGYCDCNECHEVFGNTHCYGETDVRKQELLDFVRKSLKLLYNYTDEQPFDFELTEDDLIGLLKTIE